MKTRITIAVAAALLAGTAHAGRSCEQKPPTVQTIDRGLALAARTQEMLDTLGQDVVVLARAGQDLTKYGQHYSHIGLAYRQPDGKGGHVWRVVHKLNHCGTAEAAVYRQGLGEFFLDDLWRYEAAFSMPSPDVQQKLLAVLPDDRAVTRLHHKPYSIVSYAWGKTYQQSNQWTIETMAAAVDPEVRTRAKAQAWLRLRDYRPAVLKLDALTRLGGRIGAANVAFDDHPLEKRFADRIETVTADSVFRWMERTGLGSAAVPVGID
ncbi:DUF2145 domain-containing protein [Noviherbaspirillum denitrificans]|uniref:DUF2145 domain-containing protein n=1 Tax=Noviherbaspirillum denitrificans TaxID=1968433 RepID=A0A254TJ70_9BURK|nr:DUF2145 domain-containing protein [Noviherbaspirillum denitrificans]OWW20633.1 hypothetical protein AYR66_15210 [Noviherbaspirillum denitrificans]